MLLLTSVMRDPAEPRALCHGDKWTHLAQEVERLKEVLWECRTVVGPFAVSCARVLSCFSHVWFFVTPWTVACWAPQSMGSPRQEYWSGLPFLSPGDLPDPGIKPVSFIYFALAAGSLPVMPSRRLLFEALDFIKVFCFAKLLVL